MQLTSAAPPRWNGSRMRPAVGLTRWAVAAVRGRATCPGYPREGWGPSGWIQCGAFCSMLLMMMLVVVIVLELLPPAGGWPDR
jgi:hypothetical protein